LRLSGGQSLSGGLCFLPGRKQSEAIFPFADVCILYQIFPRRLTVNGKIGSPLLFSANSNAKKALYMKLTAG
jgi:hypothetical protein